MTITITTTAATITAYSYASDRQAEFIANLLGERDLSDLSRSYRERILEIATGTGAPMSRAGASALIDTLLDCPHAPQAAAEATLPDVPAGYYALDTVGEDAVNGTAFYRVDRPETGRWAGHTFVKHLISDEERRVPRQQAATILARIAEDTFAASTRYGHEIGRCGVCNRTLTNDASRAAGIGPVCAAKF